MNSTKTKTTKRKKYSETEKLFRKINTYTCFVGLLNLWNDFRVPPLITKWYYLIFFKFMSVCIYVLMLSEISAFLKRDELNEKQVFDCIMFAISHPILNIFYLSVRYYKEKVRDLLFCLTVQLKLVYNDEEVEKSMIKRTKIYMILYLWLYGLTLVFYGIDNFVQVIRSGKTFTTVLTVWPDVADESTLAAAARIAYYVSWWFLILRSSTAYILTIATTICLSHQFKNLQSYFYKLDDIFNSTDLSQLQKEKRYERGLKVGIRLHSDTLWCFRHCQTGFGLVYSGQMIINLTGLAVLMLQMVNSERTILNAVAIVTTAAAVLVTTGVFMWNAGDITIEASKLATAMYSSGWQHCERGAALRVRTLLVVAMTQAQKPVTIRGCGVTELSYRSYLSMVKASYSVFSVVY